MTSPTDQQTFLARMDGIHGATAFAESFCQRQGLAADDALRLSLIIEELFTNTVTHGHRGDSDAVIGLGLSREGATLTLVYEDRAAPFDPVDYLSQTPPELDASADQRPVGGLGVHLVAQLARDMAYSRVGDINRLIVQLQCSP